MSLCSMIHLQKVGPPGAGAVSLYNFYHALTPKPRACLSEEDMLAGDCCSPFRTGAPANRPESNLPVHKSGAYGDRVVPRPPVPHVLRSVVIVSAAMKSSNVPWKPKVLQLWMAAWRVLVCSVCCLSLRSSSAFHFWREAGSDGSAVVLAVALTVQRPTGSVSAGIEMRNKPAPAGNSSLASLEAGWRSPCPCWRKRRGW